MSRTHFYGTLVGKKVVVAVSGVILFGFLLGHMTGNIKVFLGDEANGVPKIDVYGHFLRTMGEPVFSYGQMLWIVRIVLITALVAHVVTVILLAMHNRNARPIRYTQTKRIAASPSARFMMWSGLFILAFVVFHILHLTTGSLDPKHFVQDRVYGNLYRAFHNAGFVAIYVTAMVFLALHLYHGVWSLFQTLGLDNPDRNKRLRMFAALATLALLFGFAAVPLGMFLGDMPEPPNPANLPPPYGSR